MRKPTMGSRPAESDNDERVEVAGGPARRFMIECVNNINRIHVCLIVNNQQPKLRQVARQHRMNLNRYKMIRTNNFPLPPHKPPEITATKTGSVDTIALVSAQQPDLYQIHITPTHHVIMFNEHEYLRRQFNSAYQLRPEGNQELVKQMMAHLREHANHHDNNLIIFNALDLTPVEELIFPWREFVKFNSDPDKNTGDTHDAPESAIKTLISSILDKKRANTVVTLSIIGIRSDGTLEDELNYEWIEEGKFLEDLANIRRSKLKVKKYRSEVKIFDLNLQQIKEWSEAEQILYHYCQIKQYIQSWKDQMEPGRNRKIGELYEICQVSVDDDLGCMKKVHKRKCLAKFNQFMPESSLVMMKISQLLKQSLQNVNLSCTRDFPIDMFLKDFFQKGRDCHYTLLTQLGTNQSLKQEVICLNMDLQLPGFYQYFKNYCDKPDILDEVKKRARNFNPMSSQEKSDIKVASMEQGINKLKLKSINTLKQGEVVAAKSFFLETFSSNEKRKPSNSSHTFNVQTSFEDKKGTFEPYQYHKPASSFQRGSHLEKK